MGLTPALVDKQKGKMKQEKPFWLANSLEELCMREPGESAEAYRARISRQTPPITT